MTFFDHSKSIIENAALLSGPIVLIISIIGLQQLTIAKKSLKINSLRDAAKFSFEIIEEYSQKFDNANQTLLKAFKECNIQKLEFEITDFSIEEYNKIDKKWRDQWESNIGETHDHLLDTANLLEGYSIPFIKKIADEDIAFNIDCYIFLHLTKLCYPFIVKKHNEDKLKLYSINTIHLYELWNSRIQSMHNEKEFAVLKEKIKKTKNIRPKPIGAE